MKALTIVEMRQEMAQATRNRPLWDAEYYWDRPPSAWHTQTTQTITYSQAAAQWSSPLGHYNTAMEAILAVEAHYREKSYL